MLYTDLIFVFAFLPVTVIVSLFDRSAEYKNLILVISSALFFSWGRPAIILLLFLTALFDYLFGLLAASEKKILRIAALALDCIMNVGTFTVFAYNGLFDRGAVLGKFDFLSFADKLIPIGIAFYTVRGISYVADVFSKRSQPEKNPFCILTYMMSYHFMLAGPAVRYEDIRPEIRKRTVTATELNDGITRFIFGLGKAVLLAPAFGKLMREGLDFSHLTTAGAWLGMLGFFGWLYWIFCGYTDMALGLGLMNGFHYPENMLPLRLKGYVTGMAGSFNNTLFRFFGMNTVYQGENPFLYAVTVLLSAVLAGVWYGVRKGTMFGILFFGVFIILEKLFLKKFFDNKPPLLGNFYTLVISLCGFAVMYFDSYWKFRKWVPAILGKATASGSGELFGIVKSNWVLIAVGVAAALPLVTDIVKKLAGKLSAGEKGYSAVRVVKTAFTLLVLCLYTVEAYQLAL